MISDRAKATRPDEKKKGVLLPLFSLPSAYGIGCISEEAFRFVDWLADTGHSYWQVLPLNPTGCGDSPYQPLSSFAGNAYFIDPCGLISEGLLTEEEMEGFDPGDNPSYIDYEALYHGRMEMLRKAYSRFDTSGPSGDAFKSFCADNRFWLDDYALFMAIRDEYGRELSWDKWPEALRMRQEDALSKARGIYEESIGFYKWTQFEFYRQWTTLKKYAAGRGIRIIGDMPVYVSYDSADCWANPGQFQLDENLQQTASAGVPPDAFAAEGQLWGNPLYDWDRMEDDGYSWWISRVKQSFRMYDVIRLDHFRGYEAYYAVPAWSETAINGEWRQGPGIKPFRALADELEAETGFEVRLRERFIAEDLGFLTDGVRMLLEKSGFPGTKVLQFGFDGDPSNIYLPENYPANCAVYTGTHDNDTTVGWFGKLEEWQKNLVVDYLIRSQAIDEHKAADPQAVCDGLIEKALTSRADICIIPIQDYLHTGSEGRINVPGTVGGNWCWRLAEPLPDPA